MPAMMVAEDEHQRADRQEQRARGHREAQNEHDEHADLRGILVVPARNRRRLPR
jgi:hypothetical protein